MDRELGQTWPFHLHLRRGGVLLATGAPPSRWGAECGPTPEGLSLPVCRSCRPRAVARGVTTSRAPAPATTLCAYTPGRQVPDEAGAHF